LVLRAKPTHEPGFRHFAGWQDAWLDPAALRHPDCYEMVPSVIVFDAGTNGEAVRDACRRPPHAASAS
jgi:hypothetical protein